MTTRMRLGWLAAVCWLGTVSPALADLTIFAGLQNAPALRPTTGIALGFGLLIVGWEVEVTRVAQSVDDLAPSLAVGTASVYVQNPIPVSGVQFYGIAGAGLYRERFENVYERNDVHAALGGGAKIELAGPLKLRLDYRYFRFRDARAANAHRAYAGLTLAF
jgi:opacity protein-like surface antigen